MQLDIKFVNAAQRAFFYSRARNQLFSGGFNNGKSYIGCLKALTLLLTFPGYRWIIARQTRANLMKTTYQTFFKICPREFVKAQNLQDGYTIFQNDSRVDWLHLDGVQDSTLRGFEVNGVLVDQGEEVSEAVYDILDARIGRWDEVEIPQHLVDANPDWPRNSLTNRLVAPSYHLTLCNPDTEFHHLFRHYHPNSSARRADYFFVEGEWDQQLGSAESYKVALQHDEEWVDKYVRGKWGNSGAQIHKVSPLSYLDYTPELMDWILRKGNLFRVLDHGETSPTSCLWVAAIGGIHIFYREYYVPGATISQHRRAIEDLSGDERYSGNFADPSIFAKEQKSKGGYWSVADEYMTSSLSGKGIVWLPADNNEYATRNRINELLRLSDGNKHPTRTDEQFAPGIYFIRSNDGYQYGCEHAIAETGAQRRKLIGYFEGKALYSDEREESVKDHAYDCVRYYTAMHGRSPREERKVAPPGSIAFYKALMKMRKGAQAASF
jgi:hypothetical protein